MTDTKRTLRRAFLSMAAALLAATLAPPGWAQTGNVRLEAMNTPDLTFEILDLRRIDGGMLRLSARVVNKSSDTTTVSLPDLRIVDGRVNGFFKDNVLIEQAYAKDQKKTVGQVLTDAKAEAQAFARFRVGS